MSKHENTKKIILVDQVNDGKTYGTLNATYGEGNPEKGITGVPSTSYNSVMVKEDEFSNNLRRVGYLLPIVDANPKLIAQTDNDGLVYTPLSNAEVDDEVPVPQGFSYESVSLPHYYDLAPTHELAYTASGKSYHFYRVRMKNSPIAHIRLKQALDVPYFAAKNDANTRVYASSYVDASSMDDPNIPELKYYVPLNVSSSKRLFLLVTFNKGLADELTVEPTATNENLWNASVPAGFDAPFTDFSISFVHDSNGLSMVFDFGEFVHILPTALTKYKTITLKISDVVDYEETYDILYIDTENNNRVYEYVDTKKVDLDFPHAGEESFVWTQHIAPLNDVSSAVPVPDGIKGIYDVVEKAGIEMFHNTNKAIGKIHRLEQEQTVQITDACRCIENSVDESKLDWCQVVHATSPTPLWIDGETLERLSKSGSYVDRLAILIDGTQPKETLEKVVVVSEVVQNGSVIKYKYLPFDDDDDETTPDQTQRASYDEYSFTSYAVEHGGEELAHGKIRVVNRTDAFSEVEVIENSVDNWVGNHYFIKPADAFMVDQNGNNERINLYTDDTLEQKVGNGSGGDMWVKIEGAEHGLLDGTDVEDSLLYANPENLAFLVPLPRGKDGMIANLTVENNGEQGGVAQQEQGEDDGESVQQGEWTISPNPEHLDEFYETSDGDGKRQFVVIKNADDNGYQIYEVEEITFAMEGGNEEP